jgi:hypothetical protein
MSIENVDLVLPEASSHWTGARHRFVREPAFLEERFGVFVDLDLVCVIVDADIEAFNNLQLFHW